MPNVTAQGSTPISAIGVDGATGSQGSEMSLPLEARFKEKQDSFLKYLNQTGFLDTPAPPTSSLTFNTADQISKQSIYGDYSSRVV